MSKGYQSYILTEKTRDILLGIFNPKFDDVIAHHITWKFNSYGYEQFPDFKYFNIIGYSIDENGLECLIVSMNNIHYQPMSNTNLHITWSLDKSKGFKPVHSKNIISKKGFNLIELSNNFEIIKTFNKF